MERETGFEPATSTLARSHSTAELLPLVLSFYSTYAFAAKRPQVTTPALAPLSLDLLADGRTFATWQKTPYELALGVSCLAAIVDTVHRHVQM